MQITEEKLVYQILRWDKGPEILSLIGESRRYNQGPDGWSGYNSPIAYYEQNTLISQYMCKFVRTTDQSRIEEFRKLINAG